MPLGFSLLGSLLAIGFTVLLVAACWTVAIVNYLFPGWWTEALFSWQRFVHRVRYGKIIGRIDRGECPTCGYSLRGNLSGTCPECGAEIDILTERIIPHIPPDTDVL